MGQLRVMGRGGDARIVWDPANAEEVKTARKMFDDLRAKGYNAYAVKTKDARGEIVKTFDPAAERIILAPPMAGG
jgi:hypothetical protein